jgi:hypothetical protein
MRAVVQSSIGLQRVSVAGSVEGLGGGGGGGGVRSTATIPRKSGDNDGHKESIANDGA